MNDQEGKPGRSHIPLYDLASEVTQYYFHCKTQGLPTFKVRKLISTTFFFFLGLHPWYMEVPRLGVELELQLLAYTTASATTDLSCICDLHHSSQQHQILNSLSEARDQTSNLVFPSQIHFPLHHDGNSQHPPFDRKRVQELVSMFSNHSSTEHLFKYIGRDFISQEGYILPVKWFYPLF